MTPGALKSRSMLLVPRQLDYRLASLDLAEILAERGEPEPARAALGRFNGAWLDLAAAPRVAARVAALTRRLGDAR